MKFTEFAQFYQRAQQLFLEFPTKTRYTVTYAPGDQVIRVKITNDVDTYVYETQEHPNVKRIDGLNSILLKLMACPSLEFESVKDIIQKQEIV